MFTFCIFCVSFLVVENYFVVSAILRFFGGFLEVTFCFFFFLNWLSVIAQTSQYTQNNIYNNDVSRCVHYTWYKSCQQHYNHYLKVCWVKWVAILTTPGINVVFEVEPVTYDLHSIAWFSPLLEFGHSEVGSAQTSLSDRHDIIANSTYSCDITDTKYFVLKYT